MDDVEVVIVPIVVGKFCFHNMQEHGDNYRVLVETKTSREWHEWPKTKPITWVGRHVSELEVARTMHGRYPREKQDRGPFTICQIQPVVRDGGMVITGLIRFQPDYKLAYPVEIMGKLTLAQLYDSIGKALADFNQGMKYVKVEFK